MKLWSDRRRVGKVGNVMVRVQHLLFLHVSVFLVATLLLLFESHFNLVDMYMVYFLLRGNCCSLRKKSLLQ